MLAIAQDLQEVIASLHAGRLKAHIPRQVGLLQRRSGSFFHTTSERFIQTGGCTDLECPAENFRLRTGEICVMPSSVPHAETPVDLRNRYGGPGLHASAGRIHHSTGGGTTRREIVAAATEHLSSPRGRTGFRYLDELSSGFAVPESYRCELGCSADYFSRCFHEVRGITQIGWACGFNAPFLLHPRVSPAARHHAAHLPDHEKL